MKADGCQRHRAEEALDHVWSPVVNTKGHEIADLVDHQTSAFPFS
jgi:hypothetical protein